MIGMNKGKIKQFNKKGIHTLEDLVKFLPRKYYDFRFPSPFKEVRDGEYQSVVGKVIEVKKLKNGVSVKIEDEQKSRLTISYFNQDYMIKMIKVGLTYIFCGKVDIKKEFYNMKQMVNPVDYSLTIKKCMRIQPIYSKIQGMSEDFLFKSMNSALTLVDKMDYIEPELLMKFHINTYAEALRYIHQPFSPEEIKNAEKRILFDDLFFYNMHLVAESEGVPKISPFIMSNFDKSKEFMDNLPFELTEGQRLALRQMSIKMKKGERLNSLVQGDVGCGKTIVAMLLMVIGANNGYQSALMAPTNILAKQHYAEIKERVEPLGFKVGLLSGEQKAKERSAVLKQLENGEIQMVVGTHSIISKDVKFKNLAIAIVDEEHRFGVAQRETLKNKAENGIHVVTMSATPIPRSLALSIHGDDIDVITINTLPKGRQPIETIHTSDEKKAYDRMYEEIKGGRQCFVVCPLVEDIEGGVMDGVDSVEGTYEKLQSYFKDKNVKIGTVVGGTKMSDAIRTDTLSKFTNKEIDILIATTVIEVGVNVPNATIMLVKNADRFGLAQLHQLRGRVGRGNYKSYCILLADTTNSINAERKIEAMCSTTNGFVIAEKDLEIRGAGNFIGTQQSGSNKYVMLMMANQKFHLQIKQEVKNIFNNEVRYNRYKYMLEEKYNYLLGIENTED